MTQKKGPRRHKYGYKTQPKPWICAPRRQAFSFRRVLCCRSSRLARAAAGRERRQADSSYRRTQHENIARDPVRKRRAWDRRSRHKDAESDECRQQRREPEIHLKSVIREKTQTRDEIFSSLPLFFHTRRGKTKVRWGEVTEISLL